MNGASSSAPYIAIISPYGDNAELFNNADSFPDLELVARGFDSPLQLHKCIMVKGSKLFRALVNVKRSTGTVDSNKMEWMFNTDNDVELQALLQALRFCYGETMRIRAESQECCALIAALKQLRVTCADEVTTQIIEFIVDKAKKDALFGAKTLLASQCYPECCSDDCKLNTLLAQVVLTRRRICTNYDAVVRDCLMKLPPEYLKMVEYGEPHSMHSEFSVRVKYITCNSARLSKEEKKQIAGCCDFNTLNRGELNQLKQLGLIEDKTFIRFYEKAFEAVEKERNEYKRRVEVLEREKAIMAQACKFHDIIKISKCKKFTMSW